MKLVIEVSKKENLSLYIDKVDSVILSLEGYAVESSVYFSLDEIRNLAGNYSSKIFVKMNKNFMNEDIESLKKILLELDSLNIKGVFFYDLAVLQLKNELSLKIDLVWNQTHMVNNYKTCDYYYSKGVKYALLGKEITLDEIIEIINNSNILSMVEVVSMPSVAFSKRKLVTNYDSYFNTNSNKQLLIHEKVSSEDYKLLENDDGTSFFLNRIMNGTSIIRDLYLCGCPYIVMREYDLESVFLELIEDTISYIAGDCSDDTYVSKYKKLGDYTNFFFKKTIYKVKKNG